MLANVIKIGQIVIVRLIICCSLVGGFEKTSSRESSKQAGLLNFFCCSLVVRFSNPCTHERSNRAALTWIFVVHCI